MEKNIEGWNITKVPMSELYKRRNKVIDYLKQNDCKGMMFFSAASQKYLTGGNFIDTERPLVYIIKTDGSCNMLVPFLELEHLTNTIVSVDSFYDYPEYPGKKHPMEYLKDLLKSIGLSSGNVAADSDGYGAHFGYTGPKISDICGDVKLNLFPRLIEEHKIIKSSYDISVIKESARWSNFSHALLQEYTKPGLKEMDVVAKVAEETARVALLTLGPDFIPSSDFNLGADYRGQIGKNTYYPHALANNATFKEGDILGTRACGSLLGYNSELERCMFIGEPTKEMAEYYHHVIAMQDIAFSIIKPNVLCSDVDKEVMRYYKENNLMKFWRHHTGHGLGLGKHEKPFLDEYDNTVIESGMIFSVEPGLYVKNLGGFRLSDSVLVTEDGAELITYYPRDIESITIK